jgi:uncharacterized membrane protein
VPIYVVIWLHLIAAAALIGGLIFFNFILKPGMEGKKSEIEKKDLLQKMGRRFRTVTWICLITLILTGSYNMLYEGGSARIETTWGVILMLKLFLFAVTFGLWIRLPHRLALRINRPVNLICRGGVPFSSIRSCFFPW